jgi:hypothetical protein
VCALQIALTKFQLLPPFTAGDSKVKRMLTIARTLNTRKRPPPILSVCRLAPFTPSPHSSDLSAGSALEAGAFLSIRQKDHVAFERHVQQLRAYYFDFASLLSASEFQYPITGLYLLSLLSFKDKDGIDTARPPPIPLSLLPLPNKHTYEYAD